MGNWAGQKIGANSAQWYESSNEAIFNLRRKTEFSHDEQNGAG
jgi:hypothetical protein